MSKRFASPAFMTLLALLALSVLTGCYGYYGGGGVGIEVGVPPPGVRAEVAITSPGPGYYWVPGYWDWSGASAEWLWVPGAWVRPPHARAVWVVPRYVRHRGHWRYERGHWR
ncbi:MAG TPA: hypothetical protein VIA62_24020 [Thermoanaerobaculia bacterium]|nr:hypothetical protein [Thermoanaerobaculia bacterium]